MALVTINELVNNKAKKTAIPAFNIDNLESAIAVTETLKALKTPIIIQTIPRTLNYGGIKTYPSIIKALMEDVYVDYCIHLDHGNSFDLAVSCIEAGFSSVMIDGSALPFNHNIKLTQKVVQYANNFGVSVEGELGVIGGIEENETEEEAKYTKVEEAIEFVSNTKVSALAVSVGTAHGVYASTPKLNIQRICDISNAIDTPLVLHGASGISDKVIRDCIEAGISKINFATELRQAYTKGLRTALSKDSEVFDPKIYMRQAIDEIKEVVRSKIKLCYNI